MEKKFYVYVHRRGSDGKVFYVGKGSGKRLKDAYGRSSHWNRVAAKHGWTAHKVASFNSEMCAFSLEVAIIAFLGRNHLTNATDGGEGVSIPSEYVREKMRLAKIGKKPSYSKDPEKWREARLKTASALRIPIVSSMGETFESGKHAVKFLKENGFPTASAGNIASCVNGNMKSAYKRTWARADEILPCYEDFIHKKRNYKSKTVIRSDGVEFLSASSAARQIEGSQGTISMVCRGERIEAYGYGWKYK